MPEGEWPARNPTGKLTALLRLLEEEAYLCFFLAGSSDAPGFSLHLFARIACEWADYQNGIPPTREFRGRGSINPRLLDAFNVLDRARARAEADRAAHHKNALSA